MRSPAPFLLFASVLGCKCSDFDPGKASITPAATASASSSSASQLTATPAVIRTFCSAIFDSLGYGALSKCNPVDKARKDWSSLAAQIQYDVQRCSDALEDTARVDVDANALPACQSRLIAVVAADDPSIDATAACDPIAHGKQKEGAPCIDQVQCAAGLVCVGAPDKTEGACERPPIDGHCKATFDVLETATVDRQCGVGGFCDLGKRTCATQAKKGEPCAIDEACAQGLVCVMSACAERRSGTGDACRGDFDCVRADYCDAKAGVCAEKKAAGAPCSDDRPCRGKCIDGLCADFCGSG